MQPSRRPTRSKIAEFCATLLEVRSRLDFDVGSRGWAYLLEGERFIDKDEIDAAQALINNCRKSGDLPLDICAEDDKRAAENLEQIDAAPRDEARGIFEYVKTAQESYTPFSFWDDLETYAQVATEKSNIKNLFLKPCAEFCVPIANFGGWADLNVRAGFMRRFAGRRRPRASAACCSRSQITILAGSTSPTSCARTWRTWHARWAGHRVISSSIRFGLNYDFIEREKLTWIENLATSKRRIPAGRSSGHPDHYKPYVQDYLRKFGVRKVEADALLKVPELGRELCRKAILNTFVPAGAPRRYLNKLKPAREELRERELDRLLREEA